MGEKKPPMSAVKISPGKEPNQKDIERRQKQGVIFENQNPELLKKIAAMKRRANDTPKNKTPARRDSLTSDKSNLPQK